MGRTEARRRETRDKPNENLGRNGLRLGRLPSIHPSIHSSIVQPVEFVDAHVDRTNRLVRGITYRLIVEHINYVQLFIEHINYIGATTSKNRIIEMTRGELDPSLNDAQFTIDALRESGLRLDGRTAMEWRSLKISLPAVDGGQLGAVEVELGRTR